MIKGTDILEKARDEDARAGAAVGAMHDGDVVAAEVQPALDAVTLRENAVERRRLRELAGRDPRRVNDLVLQLGLPIDRQRLATACSVGRG